MKVSCSKRGWSFGISLVMMTLFTHLAFGQMKVLMMPSYTVSETYANTIIGSPLAVWGNVSGGTAPYQYVLDFGDGSTVTGTVSDVKYIGQEHTYELAGLKTATLTITDDASQTLQAQAVIRVFPALTRTIEINMAIEKGLLWLYQSQSGGGAWSSGWGSDYEVAETGLAALSFEENGHLPAQANDIYAAPVQAAVTWLLAQGATYTLVNHSDGVTNRNCDVNTNGVGVYFDNNMYANGCALLAIISSTRSVQNARDTTVSEGALSGRSLYSVVEDALEQIAYCQGDGYYRGGWSYSVATTGESRFDGSVMQWPIMAMIAANSLWGMDVPQWVKDNALVGYGMIRNGNGGYGYDSSSTWVNIAKTAGALSLFAWLGMNHTENAEVQQAISFIGTNFLAVSGSYWSSVGWARNPYAMYGLKKGFELLEGGAVKTVNTPAGSCNVYDAISALLLGDTNLPSGLAYSASHSYMFGPAADGHWSSSIYYPSSPDGLSSAWAILCLTRGVLVAPPVAQIQRVSSQPPGRSFQVDGSHSFHMDNSKNIVQWFWDFDAADGLDWEDPDAVGQRPTCPGYPSNGVYTVTLRVQDDGTPPLTETYTIQVTISDLNHPPVAVAIPPDSGNGYAGRVGQPITLDGRASYDPDEGDQIMTYEWDLNGDGIFGDDTNATVVVTFDTAGEGEVGLRVTDMDGLYNENVAYVRIAAAQNDLRVSSYTLVSNVGTTIVVRATCTNDPLSDQGFSNVVVRFYDGNPWTIGNQIGSNRLVNLPVGAGVTFTAELPKPATNRVYVFLDAIEHVTEWNETNNVASLLLDQGAQPRDITAQLQTMFIGCRRNKRTGIVTGSVFIRNISKTSLPGPFLLVVQPTAHTRLAHPTGTLPDGREYLDLTAAVQNALRRTGNHNTILDWREKVLVNNVELVTRVPLQIPSVIYTME